MIKSVIIKEDAYRQMLSYVLDFANPNRPYRQWREVIGWLIGSVDNETVTVIEGIPMSSGSSIFVEMTDYSVIPSIVSEAEKKNAAIIGWFHSHPSFGFFLSGVDIRTQRYQQSLFENAIALVCDPTKISSIESGIHGYQVYMEAHRGREYRELDIRVELENTYTNILEELLLSKGVSRSFAEVIAYDALADLYALEGITPPYLAFSKATDLLPSEREAEPRIEASYYIQAPLKKREEGYIHVKLSNIGEGIAYLVDVAIPPSYDFEMLS
ncbi:MAG: hypothetical protein EU548_09970, partial [Promethearchaeota archaeon]